VNPMNSRYEQDLIEEGFVKAQTLRRGQRFADISGNRWVKTRNRTESRNLVYCVDPNNEMRTTVFGGAALVLPLRQKDSDGPS